MTMDRVHNLHHLNHNNHNHHHHQQQPSQQHAFQHHSTQQQSSNPQQQQHVLLHQHQQQPSSASPPVTTQQHLYRRNHNHNDLPHINHYHQQNQKSSQFNGNNVPLAVLHRPAHPPPPPPQPSSMDAERQVSHTIASRNSLTHSNEIRLPLGIDGLIHDNFESDLIPPNLDNCLPASTVRLGNAPNTIRNSITHNYVNANIQQYQPSNSQAIHERASLSYQKVAQNCAPQQRQYHIHNQHDNGGLSAHALPQSNRNEAGPDQDVQDHFTENVIQAILAAKEALEKPIVERDERDIMLIDNLCSLVHGFDVFPKAIRRALAAQAVLIVIDEKGKELIVHNEELDSFCVLIFGECEQLNVAKTVATRLYRVGDAFGVCEPTTEIVRFVGHMVTRCENCAFLCVERDDFNTILTDPANYPTRKVLRHRDRDGNVICISQLDDNKRSSGPIWSRSLQSSNPLKVVIPDGHVISKATEACLLLALVDGYDRMDLNYIDDFLLLFRVFMTHDPKDREKKLPPGMIKLCLTLAQWLDNPCFRDRVVKIVLTWLGSYYHDFELNSEFSYLFFRVLESRLLNLSMNNQLHLLHVTLSTKSKVRQVTISRSSREAPLPFTISGGYEKNCGIFVTSANGSFNEDSPHDNLINYLMGVSHSSRNAPSAAPRQKLSSTIVNQKIATAPLRPGDQILEVNGTNFTAINLVEAQNKLDTSTLLILTVRYNPSAFNEMRALPEGRRKSSLSSLTSVSPYQPSTASSRFTFNHLDQQSDKQIDQYPQASPLFSTNANFGFRSMIRSGPKSDKSRLSSLISSSKQFVKQIRESTVQATNSIETMSKTSDTNNSDEISNSELDVGRTKSNPELVSSKSKDKLLESGLSNIMKPDNLTPSIIAENHSGGSEQALVNVLRVFNAANNDSRYLLVHDGTTAREVVMVAVREFNLASNSSSTGSPGDKLISSLNWHLYEVSVVPESKTIKQKCLPEQMSRLAEKASLCSRFYIKNSSQSSFGPSKIDMGDDLLVNEILKENPPKVTLTSLNAALLAVELTLADFDKFRSIEPQQFVYDTFFDYSEQSQENQKSELGSLSDVASLKSSSSDSQDTDRLQGLNKTRHIPSKWMHEYKEFADISNKEMFWVVCEILNERSINRRVKVIKQFVRVADVCSQLRNYNSMFAIISGLGHSCVNRLKRTFDKLKPKYKDQLEKMRNLFDPSRNMSNYRMCLNQTPPPAIPLFPQIKKDLTFTKEGRSIFVREPNDLSDDEDLNDAYSQSTIKRKTQGNAAAANRCLDSSSRMQASDQATTRQVSYTAYKNRIPAPESDSILINFSEIRQFTERVRNVIYFSSVPYSNDLLTNTKDNQKNQAQIKKMHEECLMRKRIRHYIEQTLNRVTVDSRKLVSQLALHDKLSDQVDGVQSNGSSETEKFHITYDERTLYQKSLAIEPEISANHKQQPHQPTSSTADRPRPIVQLHPPNHQLILTPATLNMHPPPSLANSSPTLSKSSSLSSCSSFNHQLPRYAQSSRGNSTSSVGKFGTESTESLRKLQSLSETSDDWDQCNSGSNVTSGTDHPPLRSRSLVPSRMFPPKSNR